jgi:hypothetical protein
VIFLIAIFGLPSIHKGVWLMLWAITLELWINRKHWQHRLREIQHVLAGG